MRPPVSPRRIARESDMNNINSIRYGIMFKAWDLLRNPSFLIPKVIEGSNGRCGLKDFVEIRVFRRRLLTFLETLFL